MRITRYSETYGQVTALFRENKYLWIGYNDGSSCRLRKVSAYNPNSTIFDIEIESTSIIKMYTTDSDAQIVLALDSASYVGASITKNNPISYVYYHDKPGGITENPVDVVKVGLYTYLLVPGVGSGLQSKLIKYYYANTSPTGTLDIEKDGDIIQDARAMTADEDGSYPNIWIVTHTDPAKLIKVTTLSLAVDFIRYLG